MRLPAPVWTGLLALVPALFVPSLVVARDTIGIPLCSADGSTRIVQVPVGPIKLPGKDKERCCAKACHAAGSRKKGAALLS